MVIMSYHCRIVKNCIVNTMFLKMERVAWKCCIYAAHEAVSSSASGGTFTLIADIILV